MITGWKKSCRFSRAEYCEYRSNLWVQYHFVALKRTHPCLIRLVTRPIRSAWLLGWEYGDGRSRGKHKELNGYKDVFSSKLSQSYVWLRDIMNMKSYSLKEVIKTIDQLVKMA